MSRTDLRWAAVGVLVLIGFLALAAALPHRGFSQQRIATAVHQCSAQVDAAFKSGRTFDGKQVAAACFEVRLGMTTDQVMRVYDPVADLPKCDDIWAIGNQPTNTEMMGDCQYGSHPARQFVPIVQECRGRPYTYNVFVGPNDRYLDGRHLARAVVQRGDPNRDCRPANEE